MGLDIGTIIKAILYDAADLWHSFLKVLDYKIYASLYRNQVKEFKGWLVGIV